VALDTLQRGDVIVVNTGEVVPVDGHVVEGMAMIDLSSLALCANKGILVKDGRALELMHAVDTVLFDETGTLTRERPEVGRVIAVAGFTPDQTLGAASIVPFSPPGRRCPKGG